MGGRGPGWSGERETGFTWLNMRKLARGVESSGGGRASREGRVQELAREKAGDRVWVVCVFVAVCEYVGMSVCERMSEVQRWSRHRQ